MAKNPKSFEERLKIEEANSTALFAILISIVNHLDRNGVLDTADLVDQILPLAQTQRDNGDPLVANLILAKADAFLAGVQASPRGEPPPPRKSHR